MLLTNTVKPDLIAMEMLAVPSRSSTDKMIVILIDEKTTAI